MPSKGKLLKSSDVTLAKPKVISTFSPASCQRIFDHATADRARTIAYGEGPGIGREGLGIRRTECIMLRARRGLAGRAHEPRYPGTGIQKHEHWLLLRNSTATSTKYEKSVPSWFMPALLVPEGRAAVTTCFTRSLLALYPQLWRPWGSIFRARRLAARALMTGSGSACETITVSIGWTGASRAELSNEARGVYAHLGSGSTALHET